MTSEVQPTEAAALSLPARMDTDSADQLREDLIDLRGAALDLDGSEVVHLGARCLGMLISAAKTWAHDGQVLRMQNASDDLERDLQRMGADLALISNTEVPA